MDDSFGLFFSNVYGPIGSERMRRETPIGFCIRAGKAAALVKEADVTN